MTHKVGDIISRRPSVQVRCYEIKDTVYHWRLFDTEENDWHWWEGNHTELMYNTLTKEIYWIFTNREFFLSEEMKDKVTELVFNCPHEEFFDFTNSRAELDDKWYEYIYSKMPAQISQLFGSYMPSSFIIAIVYLICEELFEEE